MCGNRFSTKGNLKVHFQRLHKNHLHQQQHIMQYDDEQEDDEASSTSITPISQLAAIKAAAVATTTPPVGHPLTSPLLNNKSSSLLPSSSSTSSSSSSISSSSSSPAATGVSMHYQKHQNFLNPVCGNSSYMSSASHQLHHQVPTQSVCKVATNSNTSLYQAPLPPQQHQQSLSSQQSTHIHSSNQQFILQQHVANTHHHNQLHQQQFNQPVYLSSHSADLNNLNGTNETAALAALLNPAMLNSNGTNGVNMQQFMTSLLSSLIKQQQPHQDCHMLMPPSSNSVGNC